MHHRRRDERDPAHGDRPPVAEGLSKQHYCVLISAVTRLVYYFFMAHRLLLPLLLCAASLAHAANHTPYLKAGPVNLDSDGRRWAERTLKKMSLEQKIGQMLMVQSQAR